MEKSDMEPILASFQAKKASQLFAALNDLSGLDTDVDIRFPEIVEWKEYSKDGQTKRHPVFFWHKGKTAGIAPSRTLKFVVKVDGGEIKTLDPNMIVLESTFKAINYRPAVIQTNIDGVKRLAAVHSFDSFFLPCNILKRFEEVLDDDMQAYIDGVDKAMKLLPSEQQLFKGPNPQACSLQRYGDCRGCLRLMLQNVESWREAREIVNSSTGLGTLYEDDNFVIRKNVQRAPYFYPMWVEDWLVGRSKEHLLGLVDELEEVAELFSVYISEGQKQSLLEVARKITKSIVILGRIENLPTEADTIVAEEE